MKPPSRRLTSKGKKKYRGLDKPEVIPEAARSRLQTLFSLIDCENTTALLDVFEQTMQELETAEHARAAMVSPAENNMLASQYHSEGSDIEPPHDVNADNALGRIYLTPKSVLEGQETEGNLITLEDVSIALKRREKTRSEPLDLATGTELRHRNSWMRTIAKSKPGDETPDYIPGLFGTRTKPMRYSLARYLESVASTREKRIVAVLAWILCTIGLLISLSFVTLDFLQSRNESTNTLRITSSNSLKLPHIFLCNTDSSFPIFLELPNDEYFGEPYTWLDFLTLPSSQISASYPDTQEMPQVSVTTLDRRGNECSVPKVANPVTFYNELRVPPECYYCLAILRSPALILKNTQHESRDSKNKLATNPLPDKLSLKLSQSQYIHLCKAASIFGLQPPVRKALVAKFASHFTNLIGRGTLDFNGWTNWTDDQLLWPTERSYGSVRDTTVYDIVDLCCNVYLFSGYFFPASEGQIQYRFDNSTKKWLRSGEGPFYPQDMGEFYDIARAFPEETNSMIAEEEYDNRTRYVSKAIHVFTNQSARAGLTLLGTVRETSMSNIFLERSITRGHESFTGRVLSSSLETVDIRGVNYVFYLSFAFETFLTRLVTDQAAVSLTAFVADFAGLSSLFLDVSVYTVIVSPIMVAARRRAQIAAQARLLSAV